MHDADLAHERDYVAGLYARLDELRAEKRAQLAQVRRAGAVGTMQNVSERDAFAALYEDRLAQLASVLAVGGRAVWPAAARPLFDRLPPVVRDAIALAADWRAAGVRFDAVLHQGDAESLRQVNRAMAARPARSSRPASTSISPTTGSPASTAGRPS